MNDIHESCITYGKDDTGYVDYVNMEERTLQENREIIEGGHSFSISGQITKVTI